MTRSGVAATNGVTGEHEATRRAQSAAADPAVSAWVSANAGTGKTHVLSRRVLRLLLAGSRPERLLCLTYTKAAAAEMSARVFEELGKWATCSAVALDERLTDLLDRAPEVGESSRARRLFAEAIETPGGLKVQTIHSFCERLLGRFPLEAGVAPNSIVLDDDQRAVLLREAVDRVLEQAVRALDAPLGKALRTVITHASEHHMEALLLEALQHREFIAAAVRREPAGLDGTVAELARVLGVDAKRDMATVEAEMSAVLDPATMTRAIAVLGTSSPRDNALAEALAAAGVNRSRNGVLAGLRRAFLTNEGEPKADSHFITKKVRTAEPDLTAALVRARDRFFALTQERAAAELHEVTAALLYLAVEVAGGFATAKSARGALDFDDLVGKTAQLLADRDATQWVLYKLDGGLDHILLDEAQDTGPLQWEIVSALAEEFFSGEGARESDRTIFSVGDEKQSIYGFQGAAPHMFATAGDRFAAAVATAGRRWEAIPLTTSFRSVEPVLDAVDRVFADPAQTPGMTSRGAPVRHVARRVGRGGTVEVWDTIAPPEQTDTDAWAPETGDDRLRSAPEQLAERIATTIERWLDGGEELASEGRPVRPGDILVLVRKRPPFAPIMVSALERKGIPVAGSDRLVVNEALAVKDLVAAIQFALLPEDDLNLAALLKSPMIGFDDDDLLHLAHDRPGTLWRSLLAHAHQDDRFAESARVLKTWRSRADRSPPYEFLATMLDRDGMRRRLLDRLGSEAAAPIDALLDLAIADDDHGPPSLQGFLVRLAARRRDLKRDLEHGRDQVRVMTVHGAKGLEAPIVFLPDTCGRLEGRAGALLRLAEPLWREAGGPVPFLWPTPAARRVPAVTASRQQWRETERRELDRLLYVAMTRARDRLYVCGFEGKRGRPSQCWYNLVNDALRPVMAPLPAMDGLLRSGFTSAQTAAPEQPWRRATANEPVVQPPAWAHSTAPAERRLVVPITPSRLESEADEQGDPLAAGSMSPVTTEPAIAPDRLARDQRMQRGTLIHALLEALPGVAPERRRETAEAFVATRGTAFTSAARRSIIEEVLGLMANPELSPLFSGGALSEVAIVAELAAPGGAGPTIRVSGQIDRLYVGDDEVMILDYKSNRAPPMGAEAVPEAYALQLAAYRLAVAQIYPTHRVRAAIVWTDGGHLVELGTGRLEAATAKLWALAAGSA